MNQCDTCAWLEYDEEYGEYVCSVNMDEDDFGRLFSGESPSCPFYRDGDEYKVVRHQM